MFVKRRVERDIMRHFQAWLKRQLKIRGWNQTEFAKRAGNIAQSTVSTWTKGGIPNLDGYIAIAQALEMPLPMVLVAAGKIEPPPPEVAEEDEIVRIIRELSEDERGIVIRMMRGLSKSRD